jgi:hypothetical protein
MLAAFSVMCNPTLRSGQPGASDAQCARVRALLVSAAESSSIEGTQRAQALLWVAEFWPDAAAAKLLARLEKDSNQEVAKGARDAATTLEEKLKSPTAQAASDGKPSGG